nr:MAG TPA: hypothetical protein [Inoviridae sp.]
MKTERLPLLISALRLSHRPRIRHAAPGRTHPSWNQAPRRTWR